MRCPSHALVLAVALLAGGVAPASAQQVPDSAFAPSIAAPAFPAGEGPVVLIDEGHHNFHTRDGGFLPFARLAGRDGQDVRSGAPLAYSTRTMASATGSSPSRSHTMSSARAEAMLRALLTNHRRPGR